VCSSASAQFMVSIFAQQFSAEARCARIAASLWATCPDPTSALFNLIWWREPPPREKATNRMRFSRFTKSSFERSNGGNRYRPDHGLANGRHCRTPPPSPCTPFDFISALDSRSCAMEKTKPHGMVLLRKKWGVPYPVCHGKGPCRITSLKCAFTKMGSLNPLEYALTENIDLKSFRMRTYKKDVRGWAA